MNQVERARVVVKIDALEKEIVREEFLLALICKMRNGLVLPIGGGEVHARDADIDELKTGEKILELGRKITYLKDCLRDNRNLKADAEMLASKIQGFDEQIETLEIFRKAEQDTLKWVYFASSVCNGEQ